MHQAANGWRFNLCHLHHNLSTLPKLPLLDEWIQGALTCCICRKWRVHVYCKRRQTNFFQEWSSESLLCSALQHYNNFQCSYAEMYCVCMCQRNNTTCKHLISWLACLLAPSLGPYHWFSIAMQMTCSCAFPYHPKMSAPKWLTLLITSTCECHRSCVSCAEVRH